MIVGIVVVVNFPGGIDLVTKGTFPPGLSKEDSRKGRKGSDAAKHSADLKTITDEIMSHKMS